MNKEERDEEIIYYLVEYGATISELADRFNLHRNTISKVLKDKGITEELYREYTGSGIEKRVKCQWCDRTIMIPVEKDEDYCTPECRRAQEKYEHIFHSGPALVRHNNGYWCVRDPVTGNTIRLERYLMQMKEGRVLEYNEWVRYDGSMDAVVRGLWIQEVDK